MPSLVLLLVVAFAALRGFIESYSFLHRYLRLFSAVLSHWVSVGSLSLHMLHGWVFISYFFVSMFISLHSYSWVFSAFPFLSIHGWVFRASLLHVISTIRVYVLCSQVMATEPISLVVYNTLLCPDCSPISLTLFEFGFLVSPHLFVLFGLAFIASHTLLLGFLSCVLIPVLPSFSIAVSCSLSL
jgi:hypothetical protein